MTAYTAHFAGLHDVLEWIKHNSFIYYQAPLDARPYSVRIERYTIDNTKPSRSTVRIWSSATGFLTWRVIDHLDRFRREV